MQKWALHKPCFGSYCFKLKSQKMLLDLCLKRKRKMPVRYVYLNFYLIQDMPFNISHWFYFCFSGCLDILFWKWRQNPD